MNQLRWRSIPLLHEGIYRFWICNLIGGELQPPEMIRADVLAL